MHQKRAQLQRRNHRRYRRAFTLIELMVAALIGVLIAGAVTTSITQLFRARASSADHEQAFSRADGAAAQIALDLTNALRRNDPLQQKVAVINGGTPGQERDELLMLMHSLRPVRGIEGQPEGDEFESQYRIMPAADGTDALWHRIDMAHDEYVDAGGIASPIAGGMVALSIQANDGTDQWFDEWDSDSDGLPHAVRISVTAKSDDGMASATALRLVALDRVPLPPPTVDDSSSSTNTSTTGSNGATTPSSTPRWRVHLQHARRVHPQPLKRRKQASERRIKGGLMKSPHRRGFATLAVFGVIIVAAVVLSMLQATAFSQAAAGRESLGRVRAYWAARGGVEATLARLEFDTLNPDPTDSFKVMDDMVDVAEGQFEGATYRIATTDGNKEVLGPSDAHSKLNINRMTRDQLLLLEPFMTEDVADSILDWIDADDDPNPMGAETPYYLSLPNSYVARNGPMKSIAELELVAGVDPRDVRGEDWNLNGLLDPNEDDGDASWPPDNADGQLDRGWSGILTADSVDGGMGASGEARLDLTTASDSDIADRIKADATQGKAIQGYLDANKNATLADFISQDLSRLARPEPGTPMFACRTLQRTSWRSWWTSAQSGPPLWAASRES